MTEESNSHPTPWRARLYTVIFEADTPAGKHFDLFVIWAILLSVVAACMETVSSVKAHFGGTFLFLEWFFTIVFSVEFILRIISVKKPFKYIFSFYGLVDLLAIIPTYLSVIYSGVQTLIVIRSLRLLRIFRLLKLARYVGEADVLMKALWQSRHKITVFLVSVLCLVLLMGALMYLIEGSKGGGFTSIPKAMYWAIVTMTTVGYGDIVPQTDVGRALAAFLMVMGYGIIAVPTGIVTAELTSVAASTNRAPQRTCRKCSAGGHTDSAKFCRMCGSQLSH